MERILTSLDKAPICRKRFAVLDPKSGGAARDGPASAQKIEAVDPPET